jgi:hypothetical protein
VALDEDGNVCYHAQLGNGTVSELIELCAMPHHKPGAKGGPPSTSQTQYPGLVSTQCLGLELIADMRIKVSEVASIVVYDLTN